MLLNDLRKFRNEQSNEVGDRYTIPGLTEERLRRHACTCWSLGTREPTFQESLNLWVGDHVVDVPGVVTALLAASIEAGEVVSQGGLLQRVWGHTNHLVPCTCIILTVAMEALVPRLFRGGDLHANVVHRWLCIVVNHDSLHSLIENFWVATPQRLL